MKSEDLLSFRKEPFGCKLKFWECSLNQSRGFDRVVRPVVNSRLTTGVPDSHLYSTDVPHVSVCCLSCPLVLNQQLLESYTFCEVYSKYVYSYCGWEGNTIPVWYWISTGSFCLLLYLKVDVYGRQSRSRRTMGWKKVLRLFDLLLQKNIEKSNIN